MDFADKIAPIKEKISRIEQQMRALPSNKVSQYNKLDFQRGKLNEQIDQMHRKHVQEQSKALEKQSRTDYFSGRSRHASDVYSDKGAPGYSKERGEWFRPSNENNGEGGGYWEEVPGYSHFSIRKEIDSTCGLVIGFLLAETDASNNDRSKNHIHYHYNNRTGEFGDTGESRKPNFKKPLTSAVLSALSKMMMK